MKMFSKMFRKIQMTPEYTYFLILLSETQEIEDEERAAYQAQPLDMTKRQKMKFWACKELVLTNRDSI